MLSKLNRLRRKKDFDLVFKNGKSFYFTSLGIKVNCNFLPYNRYGIIVSNKVSKKAVKRNKLKRQIRNLIQEWQNNIILGYDIIIITQPSLSEKKYKDIEKFLYQCFLRLNLFII